jgi:hypothetical protein
MPTINLGWILPNEDAPEKASTLFQESLASSRRVHSRWDTA